MKASFRASFPPFPSFGSNTLNSVGEIAIPEPGPNEVQCRVVAASVNPVDWKLLRGDILRSFAPFAFPGVPGMDFSGVVTKVGSCVRDFKVGDAVMGSAQKATSGAGSFAEYVVTTEGALARKPQSMTFAEASACVVMLTAYVGLSSIARVQRGHKVLVINAAGGTGQCAVQMAKAMGATVYAVCSTDNVDFVRSLGADRVIDRKKESFKDALQGETLDVVLDCVGGDALWLDAKTLMNSKGVFVTTTGPQEHGTKMTMSVLVSMMLMYFGRKLTWGAPSYELIADLAWEQNWKKAVKFVEEMESFSVSVRETFELEKVPDAIAAAMAFGGHGKIVIAVDKEAAGQKAI